MLIFSGSVFREDDASQNSEVNIFAANRKIKMSSWESTRLRKFLLPEINFRLNSFNFWAKMFKTLGLRCRRHTCKVVLLTSLAWCFLDLLILMTYSDCTNGMGWACSNSGNGEPNGKRGALKFAHELANDFEPPKSKWEGYERHLLKNWWTLIWKWLSWQFA